MADIKMNFNGDVSIEKMFDIHDNQQVAIYNNNNTENKEKQNNPLKDISEENFNIPSNVFCVTELHRTYWKEFCDAYYFSLGFSPYEKSTYEQKYKTFCQLKGKLPERKGEIERGLSVKKEDLKFLKILEKRLYTLKEREELISTLYYYVRTIESVRRKISNDIWVIKNINPCYIKADYSEYLLDETHRFTEGEEYWPIIRDVLKYPMNEEMLKEMMGEEAFFEETADVTETVTIEEIGDTFEYNNADGSIISLVNEILEGEVKGFNHDLLELTALLSENNKCSDGNELKLFLYRFFMSYENSLPEIKNMLEELPSPLNLNRLKEVRNRLINTFSKTHLGNQWILCMEHEDGIKYIAKYFMNQQNVLTTEEKYQFFYNLDKICIIEEILKGNAQKYGLKVDYPEDWFATEKKDRKENKNYSSSSIAQSNIIFNPHIFTTETCYRKLYETIRSFIKQREATTENENETNRKFQINPEIQAEWYYILKAIDEAKVTRRSRKLTDADFLRQMRIWFPAFFLMKEDEDEEKMIRRYASSLSVERQKWIESSEKQEIAISDMIAHSQKRDRDRLKAIRYHGIAEGLRAQLEEMKKKGY